MMQSKAEIAGTRDTGVSVVDMLLIEHQLLRGQMRKLASWEAQGVSDQVLGERAALLAVALEAHAQFEEAELFASLARRTDASRALIEPMELEHEQIRALFDEIRNGTEIRSNLKRVLSLADLHFAREEEELFPLAVE